MTYTKEELITQLRAAHEEDGKIYDILNDRINDYPTVPTYNKYFDTLDEAYEAAGLDRKKFENDDDSDVCDFDSRAAMEACDGYDPDADGYVYVLEFEERTTDFEFLYVGSTCGRLFKRLSCHRSRLGAFNAVKKIDGVPVKVGVHRHKSYITDLKEVQSFYADDYDLDDAFMGPIVDAQETIRYDELVAEHGSLSVLGGN